MATSDGERAPGVQAGLPAGDAVATSGVGPAEDGGVMAIENGWALTRVRLNELVVDRALNPRLDIDKETVEHYMEVFDQLPPVEAFDTERGRLLVDGWHRFSAGKALGLAELAVKVRKGSYREAVEYAALANVRHGRPLTARERGRVAETLLLLHPERSDNAIAKTVGCSHMTVGKIRQRLEAEGRLAKMASRTVTGIDGVERVVSPRLGAAPDRELEPEPEPPDPWAGMLLEGDTFDRLSEVEDASADLIFVDPPYGILAGEGQAWDTFESVDALMAFTRSWIEAVLPKLKPTGRLFVCFSQWYVHLLRQLLDEYADPSRFDLIYSNTIIWHYKNILSQPNDRCEFKLAHEPILYYRGRYAPPLDFSVYGEEQGDVWEIATPQSNFREGKHHPAQKPLELLRRIIAVGCPADGLVLDPMAGSGTAAVAAYELTRAFRVIEREPKYVTVIRQRLDSAARQLPVGAGEVADAAGG